MINWFFLFQNFLVSKKIYYFYSHKKLKTKKGNKPKFIPFLSKLNTSVKHQYQHLKHFLQ